MHEQAAATFLSRCSVAVSQSALDSWPELLRKAAGNSFRELARIFLRWTTTCTARCVPWCTFAVPGPRVATWSSGNLTGATPAAKLASLQKCTRIWLYQLTTDLRDVYFFGYACNGRVWKQFRCLRLSRACRPGFTATGALVSSALRVQKANKKIKLSRVLSVRYLLFNNSSIKAGSLNPPRGENGASGIL